MAPVSAAAAEQSTIISAANQFWYAAGSACGGSVNSGSASGGYSKEKSL